VTAVGSFLTPAPTPAAPSGPQGSRSGPPWLGFELDATHEAHEPPEARGLRRDGGRLLVSDGRDAPVDTWFSELGRFLRAGDVVVVNTTATIPAALDGELPGGTPVVVHLSTLLPGDLWLVEVREPMGDSTRPYGVSDEVTVRLAAGAAVRLLVPFGASRRLWIASLDLGPGFDRWHRHPGGGSGAARDVLLDDSPPTGVLELLAAHGRPIRYRHVPEAWPISAYQTIFARHPGSAEMPSASRPFSPEVVTELVGRGIVFAPLVLHTGVSSLEGGEDPYPERYRVPSTTAALLNARRRDGGRVIAAGTTVVRALATVSDEHGDVHAGAGWTDVVVTGDSDLTSVDGLLTGWHEPESTHLLMLEAFADHDVLRRAYRAALDGGYLWHEFGDSHLLLRPRAQR
jgi:S-adenosylmethionine:tRNA ribosyltransferase-isomerase